MGAWGHKDEGPRVVYVDRKIEVPVPNPNPKNFYINRSVEMRPWLILDVTYPDCTNYEGRKILVYKGVNFEGIVAQGSIDPHFSNNRKYNSPFARFVPTELGWETAIKFCEDNP